MRGLFFASVSHDLKRPLNAILGFAELTERKEVLSSGQRESLGLIIQRGNELLALIETILDAARVEAGQLTLTRTEDSLEELVQLAIEKGRLLSAGSETVVLAEVAPNLPKLFVDRIRLQMADAKSLAFSDGQFDGVMSNSIIHHLPEPIGCLREAVRVTKPGGLLFFRDLLRPGTSEELARLVELYAPAAGLSAGADHQRAMFADSLHAALLNPKNAAVRGTMIEYFAAKALVIRAAQLKLAKMPYSEKQRMATEFKAEIVGLNEEERDQLGQLLRSGLLPVPSDLNQMLLAAFDGREVSAIRPSPPGFDRP